MVGRVACWRIKELACRARVIRGRVVRVARLIFYRGAPGAGRFGVAARETGCQKEW